MILQVVHRIMVDAADPRNIPRALKFDIAAGYGTGTPGEAWSHHWDEFPGKDLVAIDQGAAPGAPNPRCTVMDVEARAYSPSDIPRWMAQCEAPRPVVYCDRDQLPDVRKLWKGPVWLAAPNVKTYPDDNLIGIQNVFGNGYDVSDIFDAYWPKLPPPAPPTTGETEMIHGMLDGGKEEFIPFKEGAFSEIMIYHDFTHGPEPIRLAVHSVRNGYKVYDVKVTENVPVTMLFEHTDVDAVSMVNRSGIPVGWTLI